MSHAAQQRSNVLRAYRELVALARGMSQTQRQATLQEAAIAIRANAAEKDPGAASDQLKLLWARISWLRVVRAVSTPLCVCAVCGRQTLSVD